MNTDPEKMISIALDAEDVTVYITAGDNKEIVSALVKVGDRTTVLPVEEHRKESIAILMSLANMANTRLDDWLEMPKRFPKEKAQWKREMNGRKVK